MRPEQILAHPWLKTPVPTTLRPETASILIRNLKTFTVSQKLQKAVLTYLATQLSEKQIAPLRAMFISLDKNGDGRLSAEEIKKGLAGRANEMELTALMQSLDTDGSGYIEYNGKLLCQP